MTCPFTCRTRRVFGWRLFPQLAWWAGCVLPLAMMVCSARPAWGTVRVVTTTPAYAAIVTRIGGKHVAVESVMRGPEDIHNVVAKPSHMMKLKRADLFVHSGLDAEQWASLLIRGSRNSRLLAGRPGNVDVSRAIPLKEVPTGRGLSRALGDIHVYGNIHYWLDPLNGVTIARTITDALKRADPEHASEFEENYEAFAGDLRTLADRLVKKMKPYRGVPVVVYHRTWPYFLDRFGLVKIGEVEPKPGISPGPRHLSACVETMKAQGAKIVIVETYNNKNNAQAVARRVGGRAVVLSQEVGALPEVDTYEKLFEYNVATLLAAFEEVGVEAQDGDEADQGRTGREAPPQP